MSDNAVRVFLSGRITGDPNYRVKFRRAEAMLTNAGFAVMNPAVLPPQGFTHSQYMQVTVAMLDVCDALFFLPDWMNSPGAMAEIEKATRSGKPVYSYEEWELAYVDGEPVFATMDGGVPV